MKISEKQLQVFMVVVPQLHAMVRQAENIGHLKDGLNILMETINEIVHQQSEELKEVG